MTELQGIWDTLYTEKMLIVVVGLEKLVVGAEYINLIWTPDTFFVNEKTAYFHKGRTSRINRNINLLKRMYVNFEE